VAQARPTISTHVLDTERGEPARGLSVVLFRLTDDGGSEVIAEHETDDDGRVRDLLDGGELSGGDYQLLFDVGSYREEGFFQGLAVGLRIDDPGRSYHVPLLLAPYGLVTYLGS
jgi:5-hydroxyisourate hydrolase